MNNLYKIELNKEVLRIGFGITSTNDQIVKEVKEKLNELINNNIIRGGEIIKINGAASLPVAFVIAHAINHLYGNIAVFDPKMSKYVVVNNHGGEYQVGDLID